MKIIPVGLTLLSCAVVATIAACTTGHANPRASARLIAATGVPQPNPNAPVQGTIHFTLAGNMLKVDSVVTGLKPNTLHAFHVHEKGDCSAPDFSSAGSHFNPTSEPHGAHDSAHHHLGDLPQLMADAKGTARVSFDSALLKLSGPHGIVGKSVIVHRDPDDVNAQPVGNAGPRLACGVIGAEY
ncbi:MAG: superoxide dismutase family protein [Burkholderiaceae bacterium]|jgi:Cu-Zn family superoxide dismutase|nr:superoxide dismutase family protein [Burkholderiaceae bacterium]